MLYAATMRLCGQMGERRWGQLAAGPRGRQMEEDSRSIACRMASTPRGRRMYRDLCMHLHCMHVASRPMSNSAQSGRTKAPATVMRVDPNKLAEVSCSDG